MRFTKVDSNVILTHGDQELVWNVKILERGKRGPKKVAGPDIDDEDLPLFDPFEPLNQYFDQLPYSSQNALFDVYRAIYEQMEPYCGDSVTELRRALPPLIKKIYEICTPENVAQWVHITPTIRFPKNIRVYKTIEESAEKGDQFGLRSRPAEATYLEKDYWGLVVLVMLLRMLVPVWGRFLNNIDGAIENNVKEIFALRLATRTALVETDGWHRLEAYVNEYLVADKFKNSAVGCGVSKEDIPFQTMAILTVRRLAWVDFSGRDPSFSLIGRVYSFIDQQMDSADRQYNETIKPKIPESGAANDHENRASVSELIKIKEPYTAGDLTVMESAAQKPHRFIARIAPDMPPEILEQALLAVEPLKRNPPLEAQFMLMQNVMGAECLQWDGQWEEDPSRREKWDAIFPPRAPDEMNLLENLSMMAVAAALLWHRGHHDLAAILTATPARDGGGFGGGGSVATAISKENLEKLKELYPYAQRPARSRRSDNPKTSNLENVAVQNIELIREPLAKRNWILNIPKDWISKLPNHTTGRRYNLKSDIRNKLAELAISIATRSL